MFKTFPSCYGAAVYIVAGGAADGYHGASAPVVGRARHRGAQAGGPAKALLGRGHHGDRRDLRSAAQRVSAAESPPHHEVSATRTGAATGGSGEQRLGLPSAD